MHRLGSPLQHSSPTHPQQKCHSKGKEEEFFIGKNLGLHDYPRHVEKASSYR
jgi:hypothetical protein